MREKRIGLLALQETHLSEPLLDQVSSLYQRRLSIYNSTLQENSTGSAGVAFVINKELLHAEDVRFHTLVPGRTTFTSFKWQPNSMLSVINVYAPNDPTKHPHFWSSLKDQWETLRLPRPDLLVGEAIQDVISTPCPRCREGLKYDIPLLYGMLTALLTKLEFYRFVLITFPLDD